MTPNIDSPAPMYGGPFVATVSVLMLALGLMVGYGIGHFWEGSRSPEPPAPPVRQDDGSLVLERRPDADPGKAPHQIPAGAKESRRVAVEVQTGQGSVRVDLSLLRLPDGTGRVVASSPDGTVVSGLDLAIAPAAPPPRPWAAGPFYGPEAAGVLVSRDLWRLRVGGLVGSFRSEPLIAVTAQWVW